MKARFEVSTEGMKALHAGREPWQLAKELVSNAFDESISLCKVTLQSVSPRKAKLTVYDDGEGFADIVDAWTLMKHTPKRGKPEVRGRFNIGEKEILSVADKAVIHTNSTMIIFPSWGGRIVRKTKPVKGTVVVCTLPWGNRQVESTIEALRKLIVPHGITYTVNGTEVPHIKPYRVIEGITLETVLQDSPTEPLRSTRRKTSVEIYKPDNGVATLYELGIPIQSIESAFSANVLQKVPMPPNRDVVKDSYLQSIYRIILEATIDEIKNPSDTWVRQAVEDKDIKPEVVIEVIAKRYGEKAALWSSDSEANERADKAGYTVVHGRTLSSAERAAMVNVGLKYSSDIFPSPYSAGGKPLDYIPRDKWTEGMINMEAYIASVGKGLLGRGVTTQFIRYFRDQAAARWDGNSITFNMAKLNKAWFDTIEEEHTGLIIHEMSHYEGFGHNWEYVKSLEHLAGRAVHLALKEPQVFKRFLKWKGGQGESK